MNKAVFDDFIPDIIEHAFRKCGPDWHIPLKTVNNYNIVYIIKGNANYRINDAVHEVKPGDLICLREGDLVETVNNHQNLAQIYDVSFRQKHNNAKKLDGGGGGYIPYYK
jgi:hypothetical protein